MTNPFHRGLVAMSLLYTGLALGAAPAAEAGDVVCPSIGTCDVTAHKMEDGSKLIAATARFAAGRFGDPPMTHATIMVDGVPRAEVAITWSIVDYFCCCPSELQGGVLALLDGADFTAPARVDVYFGDECSSSTFVVPVVTATRKPVDGARMPHRLPAPRVHSSHVVR